MKKIGIILLFFLCIACTSTVKQVNYEETKKLLDEKAILLDVRTPLEYDQGHIEGAINIPLPEIDLITYPKESKIIVYCRSGKRSYEAAEMLKELGYKNVYDLGSKENWKEKLVKKES